MVNNCCNSEKAANERTVFGQQTLAVDGIYFVVLGTLLPCQRGSSMDGWGNISIVVLCPMGYH